MPGERSYYLVCRPAFHDGDRLERSGYSGERVSTVPVGLHADREAALAAAVAAEREFRQAVSPFLLATWLDHLTSLDCQRFRERLVALGIPDAASCPATDELEGDDWPRWWARVADRLTDEQRDAVWGLFDRLKLFEVRPVRVAP